MRVAICIGCDSYDHLSRLEAAEGDARRMFEVLTDPKLGAYDREGSRLLLSPNLESVRVALNALLYGEREISDFTFFFAGHAGVAHDSLYLALRETELRSIALSGFGFGDLAKIVVAARPAQANFILDACNTAGLGLDLSAVLRQSLTGTADTTGVAALAAAAADETAAEFPEGGAFTAALLDILGGRHVVQRDKPFIGIPEIGGELRLARVGPPQTISTWMLNLQGPNRFSLNPNYTGDLPRGPDFVVEALGRRLDLPRSTIAEIKRVTLEFRDRVDELGLAVLLERIVAERTPDDATLLLSGLAEGMAEEARTSPDPFAEGRVLGVFLGQLLRFSSASDVAIRYLTSMLDRTFQADLAGLRLLDQELTKDRFRLLSSELLADLFFLPLRVSDLLGRIGWLLLSDKLVAEDLAFLDTFLRRLLGTYGNSVLAVSDEQGGPTLVFLAGCVHRGWTDVAEEVIGRLIYDLIANSARVARHFVNGTEALRVLDQRYSVPAEFDGDLYQQPSDLVSVVIICAALLRLDEAIDHSLILIDHTPINVLAPNKVAEIGSVGPISGKNIGLNIGHGVWRCIDIRREWQASVVPYLTGVGARELDQESAALLSTLTLRDRVPWFVAKRLTWSTENTFTRVDFR